MMCDFRHGVRHGEGVVVCPQKGVARLCGTFVEGKLQGKVQLVEDDFSPSQELLSSEDWEEHLRYRHAGQRWRGSRAGAKDRHDEVQGVPAAVGLRRPLPARPALQHLLASETPNE